MGRAIELLQRHCLLGQVHYRYWKRLNNTFGETPNVGNLAPTFFLFTADAQLNSALLILNRLVDKRRDSLSIRNFLRKAKGLAQHFPKSTPGKVIEAVAADLSRVEGFEATVAKIQAHRNGQFVHLSAELLDPPYGAIPAEDAFAYAEVYDLLVHIGEILNRYAVFLTGSELLMKIWNEEEDFEYLKRLLDVGATTLESSSSV